MISGRIKRRLIDNNTGSILVMALIFSMATIILGAAFLMFADSQRRQITYDIMKYKAWAAAHANMVRGMVYYNASGVRENEPRSEFYRDENDEFEVDYERMAVTRENEGADSLGFSARVSFFIQSIGYVTNPDYDIEVTEVVGHGMSSSSYADWLYISDKETQTYRPDTNNQNIIYFWGGDTLDGKVHSNDIISFQMREGIGPVFEQLVTSCADHFNPTNAQTFVTFKNSFKLNYHYFEFPLQAIP
jgi:hypothetical protein